MNQGFYNLTSSMLTQTRNLNVISNNMANVSTTGYKSDKFISQTFEEVMLYSSNNKAMVNASQVGEIYKAVVPDRNYTDFGQAGVTPTTHPLDFALQSSGFFTIQTDDGNVYTRNGSFSLDAEGYLTLQGIGRVMGQNGPIQLTTDQIIVDSSGNIFSEETGQLFGTLAIVDFEDYDAELTKTTGDVFIANGTPIPVNGNVVNKALEGSNVDSIEQMTDMMASQRALQSSAQVMQMYDQLLQKIVTQLGPR